MSEAKTIGWTDETKRAVGYTRVSTAEQAESKLGLESQRAALVDEAARRGWSLQIVEDPGYSGKDLRRPGIEAALEALRRHEYDALIVSKLDRLSRSIMDFGSLVERARREGWVIVALDLGVDTSTPAGELVANVMISVAQWERRVIGQRTKDALAVKRSQGVVLGRPVSLPDAVARRICRARKRGQTYARIAATLNAEGVPTAQGGTRWHPSTVRAVEQRVA